METESVPLLVDDSEDEVAEKPDFKRMVFFHGKELSGRSFVRTPQHNVVRIGVGEQGVYKVDSKTPKVLAHWKFNEIKDCSFSGYSFTLQLRSGGDYYVRTDDGEPICSYIDLFQKNPQKALDQARNNPPISKVPESGLLTLRRKFSEQPSTKNEVKFYTLNRRSSKNNTSDPYTKLTQQHNIEVDSRLRSDYRPTGGNSDAEGRHRGYSFEGDKARPHSMGSHVLDNVLEGGKLNGEEHKGTDSKRQQARDVLVTKITEAAGKEKRMSNGIRISPVSTKGEVTTTQSTKVSPPPPSSSMSPAKSAAAKEGDKSSKVNSPETGGSPRRDTLPSDSSSDTIPSVRPGSSNSSAGTFSPTDEFQFLGGSEKEPLIKLKKSKVDRHDRASSEETYDRLDPLEQMTESDIESATTTPPMTTPTPTTPTPSNPGIIIMKGNGSRWSMSSNESGEYDHLPALQSPPAGGNGKKGHFTLDQLPSAFNISDYRRITSQPALSTPASARESPIERSPSSIIPEETSEEEDEDDELGDSYEQGKPLEQLQGTELQGGEALEGGVVLRKRNKHLDPFADILNSPHGAGRLRWSQELNPLYDYIKGYKISEGVRLYDSPSKLLQSANASDVHRKSAPVGGERGSRLAPPSIIVEEESECSSREQTCSPSESQGEEDSKSELEMPTETSTLPRMKRPHVYEEISFADLPPEEERPSSEMGMVEKLKMRRKELEKQQQKAELKSASLLLGRSETSPVQRRRNIRALEKAGVSPRIGKRELQQQRRSRTVASLDDSATEVKRKPQSMKAGDSLKDFSFVMREYRLFFVKLPNGLFCREIFPITKPISELREKLCEHIGVDHPDHYQLYVEGACLTFLKEGESSAVDGKVNRAGSFTHIVDSQSLPDQGNEPFRLKSNLSFRMQGITTSRILSLVPDDEATDSSLTMASELLPDQDEDFHKNWMSIVHGSVPCALDDAVKLAALQYQSYFLDRTAVHSVVGFCRPTEFLPHEYSGIRGIEQKMYKEQEILKMKSHKDIKANYNTYCAKLPTYDCVFFPAREPRKKLLHSTKLKPIIIGVGPKGVLRVDPKSKEVLDTWPFSCLRNWAYSKRTFVLAFTNKNYPVESNQAKWICQLIDFYVDMLATAQHHRKSQEEDTSGSSDVFPPA